mmetsp:Transcript_149991/g.264700  ORF Transcript_149991/g.264700 Transcript_149991/m.264700 type:complete len:113 (-) Transcript_149991:462-800(-)
MGHLTGNLKKDLAKREISGTPVEDVDCRSRTWAFQSVFGSRQLSLSGFTRSVQFHTMAASDGLLEMVMQTLGDAPNFLNGQCSAQRSDRHREKRREGGRNTLLLVCSGELEL